MEIESFESRYMQSKAYLVIEGSRGVIVDPANQGRLSEYVYKRDITIDYIFLTHEHCDHIIGVEEARSFSGAPVICTRICGENIANSRKNFSRYFEAFASVQGRFRIDPDLHVEPFIETADEIFDNRMRICWMGHEIELKGTPGHSPGSMCVLIDNKILFSGDTLLKNDYTMFKLMGGSRESFNKETEPWLRSLNKEIIVYPGHMEEFVLGERLNKTI